MLLSFDVHDIKKIVTFNASAVPTLRASVRGALIKHLRLQNQGLGNDIGIRMRRWQGMALQIHFTMKRACNA